MSGERTGLIYNYIKKKVRFNAGSNVGFAAFDQKNVFTETTTFRHFVNWYPQASMTYSFSQQRSFTIRYNGYTMPPTIQQIQPLPNNEDPLNVSIGNPGLKPQFVNNLVLRFNNYNPITKASLNITLNASFIQDNISSKDSVDSSGRRIYQFINVNGYHAIRGNAAYWFNWKPTGMYVGITPFFSNTRNVSVVNNTNNITNSSNVGLRIAMNKFKEKRYLAELSYGANYTLSQSSLDPTVSTRYWIFNVKPGGDVFLPYKFQVHADCDLSFRQKTEAFAGRVNTVILDAWIGRKFLKDDVLLIKASVNDLLDQNIGFARRVSSNYLSQDLYSTIHRYFMLSVLWNFNHH